MVARQSVGSRYNEIPFVFLGLATATAIGYVILNARQQSPDLNAMGVAFGIGLAFLLRCWLVARDRRWLSPADGGFVLEDRHGSRFVEDADVTSLATEKATRYEAGVPAGTVHHGAIALRDGRVPFRYGYPLDQPDPLGYLFELLLKRLTKRAAADLMKGGSLYGEGWELSPSGLRYEGRQGDGLLADDEMAAADVVDGHVCVWARGDLHPAARIPAGSPNALVLFAVLRSFVDTTAPDDAALAGGLGRALFERGRSANLRTLLGVMALFEAMLAGLGGAAMGWEGAGVVAGIGAIVMSPVLLAAVLTAGNVFRCHAAGVYRRTGWWVRELRFTDLATFTYAATRSYVHGVYVGTSVRMRFSPRPGSGGRAVAYSASVKNGDPGLDNLREHVSRVMAQRMLQEVEQGEWVAWTRGLALGPDGLEVLIPGGLFRRSSTRIVPFAEIDRAHIEDGYFFLFLRGMRKAVYTTPVSVVNFFPGLVLLDLLQARPTVVRQNLHQVEV